MSHKILVIDDEKEVCSALKDILSDEGYTVITSLDPESAIPLIRSESPNLVLLDVWFRKDMDKGISVLEDIRLQRPYLPVIIISGHAASHTYKQVIRHGASAVLEKPININNLIFEINRCIELQRLKSWHHQQKSYPKWPLPLGQDMQELILSDAHIFLASNDHAAVERLAYAAHTHSERRDYPCDSLSAHHINAMDDALLWGIENMGTVEKTGLLDRLYGGTLILKDIHALNASQQKEIARVIKKKSFERIGSQGPITSNLRVIATAPKAYITKNISPRLLNCFASPFVDVLDINNNKKDFATWIKTLVQEMFDQKGTTIPDLSPENIEKIRNSPYGATLNTVQYILSILSDDTSLSLFIKHSLYSKDEDFFLPTDAFHQPWPKAKHLFESAYLDFHMKRHGTIAQMAKALHINRTALHKKIQSLRQKISHTPDQ